MRGLFAEKWQLERELKAEPKSKYKLFIRERLRRITMNSVVGLHLRLFFRTFQETLKPSYRLGKDMRDRKDNRLCLHDKSAVLSVRVSWSLSTSVAAGFEPAVVDKCIPNAALRVDGRSVRRTAAGPIDFSERAPIASGAGRLIVIGGRDFSRPGVREIEDGAVRTPARTIGDDIPSSSLCSTQLDDELPKVLAHRVQLQQVVLNLIVNAIEAMGSVGDRVHLLRVTAQVRHPKDLLITIEDSGCGIEPKDIDRIFDRFFTTKSHGIGMGLWICRSIVEAHEGRLWAEPGIQQGSVFRLQLPIPTSSN